MGRKKSTARKDYRPRKYTDKDFNWHLKSFTRYLKKRLGGHAYSRFNKKMILHKKYTWSHFLHTTESEFKIMFDLRFRIKLINILREHMTTPTKKNGGSRVVKFTNNRIDLCKK